MISERDFVFNVVWTGSVFTYLRYFAASQIHFSDARFRFVANGCPPDQVEAMERFRAEQPDRVVEVLETSPTMRPHGASLDTVRKLRDDGPFFCMIDADILARGPFLAPFAEALETAAGITSGRGVWRDDDVVPPGHPGVSGEYFYSQSGYLFGSPHFAMYHRERLEATSARWALGFADGGPKFSDAVSAQLLAAGHDYYMYDTGKVLNILLQEDGNELRHAEHPNLMHIGGVSHYLAPQKMVEHPDGGELEPDWKRMRNMETRFEVAEFTAIVLRALSAGDEAPELPPGLDPAVEPKLHKVRDALIELFDRFSPGLATE